MTATSATAPGAVEEKVAPGEKKALKWVNSASGWLDALGFTWLIPILKIAAGDSRTEQFTVGDFCFCTRMGRTGTSRNHIAWRDTWPGSGDGTSR